MGKAGGTFVDRPAYCNGSRGKVLERGFGIACIQEAVGNIQETVRILNIFMRIIHMRNDMANNSQYLLSRSLSQHTDLTRYTTYTLLRLSRLCFERYKYYLK